MDLGGWTVEAAPAGRPMFFRSDGATGRTWVARLAAGSVGVEVLGFVPNARAETCGSAGGDGVRRAVRGTNGGGGGQGGARGGGGGGARGGGGGGGARGRAAAGGRPAGTDRRGSRPGPGQAHGHPGRQAVGADPQGVRHPGGAGEGARCRGVQRGTAGTGLGRARRPVHHDGTGDRDDATSQTGRPAADRDGGGGGGPDDGKMTIYSGRRERRAGSAGSPARAPPNGGALGGVGAPLLPCALVPAR